MNASYPKPHHAKSKAALGALPAAVLLAAGAAAAAQGPSYACGRVKPGTVEALICADAGLSALDRKLAAAYAAASAKARNERRRALTREQRGWLKDRDNCRKRDEKRACVETAYQHRIAELLARYGLIDGTGPFTFVCDGAPAVVATFFQTDPPTVVAERGDSVALMYLQPSDSGAKYQSRNEMFWHHQGAALITWGFGAKATRCQAKL